MTNFYHAANASRAVKLSTGKKVTFDVYRYFAGAWLGIAAVEDPETIEGLEELTRKPKSGITRITEEEYKDNLKKKAVPRNSPRLTESPLLPPQAAVISALAGRRAGVVVEGADKKTPVTAPIPTAKVYDSMDEVLSVGTVKAPASAEPAAKPKHEEGQRSGRALSGQPSREPKHMSEMTESEKEAMQ